MPLLEALTSPIYHVYQVAGKALGDKLNGVGHMQTIVQALQLPAYGAQPGAPWLLASIEKPATHTEEESDHNTRQSAMEITSTAGQKTQPSVSDACKSV